MARSDHCPICSRTIHRCPSILPESPLCLVFGVGLNRWKDTNAHSPKACTGKTGKVRYRGEGGFFVSTDAGENVPDAFSSSRSLVVRDNGTWSLPARSRSPSSVMAS